MSYLPLSWSLPAPRCSSGFSALSGMREKWASVAAAHPAEEAECLLMCSHFPPQEKLQRLRAVPLAERGIDEAQWEVTNLVAEHGTNVSFHGTVSQKSRHSTTRLSAQVLMRLKSRSFS